MKKKLLLIISLIVFCLVAVGCGGDQKAAPSKQSAKVLKVGTNPDFAPFEFQEKDKLKFGGGMNKAPPHLTNK